MADIILKTSSRLRPMMVNGRRISHSTGSKKINTSAKGQHITNKINQRRTPIIVFMKMRFIIRLKAKRLPI
jgi:hypothetical protein